MKGPESSKRAVPIKKKEAETHMVGTGSHHTSNPYPVQPRPRYRPPPNFYYPPQSPYYQAPPPYPVYATDNQRPFAMFPPNSMPAQSQPKNEQRPTRSNLKKPQFTLIPVSYGELYPKLLEKQLISPHYMAPLKPPYLWYDPNASYIYHAGNQGHFTENCLAFKRRVQGLIDASILRFDGAGNTAGNPLPNHTKGNVSAVVKEDKWRAKSCVSEIKTPLRKIWEGHDIQSCEGFIKLLQDMMDNKEVEIFNKMKETDKEEVCTSDNQSSGFPYSADRPLVIYYDAKKEQVKPKMIIEVPSHFFYKDNRQYHGNMMSTLSYLKAKKSKVTTGNVGEVGHFTRSGRCYSKAVEPMKKTDDLKQKGKALIHKAEVELETPYEQEAKRPVNEEEAHEFLKFIKHSEYNVVEQLSKQSAQISVMDITPSYNCLLGRPWIYSAGAVPSSLHQKVKFIMDSLLVTVMGEEDIVASISADTP
ncbi:uncharacterized protein LOC108458902 [Gossypium arboreum]|uniref:uncharacterized protein LOC108458902 n=1 Tax=Gossypium arboreum TaxID=29729 RepID=UPI0008196C4E|nr:uncharacterized protein LOC108458902 [Gossypium arboreum]